MVQCSKGGPGLFWGLVAAYPKRPTNILLLFFKSALPTLDSIHHPIPRAITIPPSSLPPPLVSSLHILCNNPATIMPSSKQPDKKTIPGVPESILSYAQAMAMKAAAPGMKVGITSTDSNTLGYVDKRLPEVMVLSANLAAQSAKTGIRHTPQHEFEHILQNRVAARYDTSYDRQVIGEYAKLGGNTTALIQHLERSAASMPLRERLQSIAGTAPAAYIGGLSGKQFSLAEQFAELSSLETFSGKDLTKDPVVRKEFFGNDDALIATYRATTGLRQERLDAKDLPPMTVQPADKPSAQQSVLDKILDAAKRIGTGEKK